MDEQKREAIAVEVFKKTGVALDKSDPVFALVDICKAAFAEDTQFFNEKQQAVINLIREIPGAINESVEIVAKAVERAEVISGELADAAVLKAKAQAAAAITDALSAHLSIANEGLAELERRVKLASNSLRDPKSFRLNMVLGVGFLLCAIALPVSTFLQMAALDKSQKEAEFYLREISALERGIEKLPLDLQEKIKGRINH